MHVATPADLAAINTLSPLSLTETGMGFLAGLGGGFGGGGGPAGTDQSGPDQQPQHHKLWQSGRFAGGGQHKYR